MIDNFETFKAFHTRWNTSMQMHEKMQIAAKTDEVNYKGCIAFENGDIRNATIYFERSLEIMPNNDDALKNLKLCYSEMRDNLNLQLVIRKLNHLGV